MKTHSIIVCVLLCMTSDPGPPQHYLVQPAGAPVPILLLTIPHLFTLFSLYFSYCLLSATYCQVRHQIFYCVCFVVFSATQHWRRRWTFLCIFLYFCPHGDNILPVGFFESHCRLRNIIALGVLYKRQVFNSYNLTLYLYCISIFVTTCWQLSRGDT